MAWATRHKQATGAALKGYKPAFTFTASPWDLVVREDGEVLPALGIVIHEKGLGGCRSTGPASSDVDETGAVVNAQRDGRTIIDHDIEVVAWGETRIGYLGDADSKPIQAQGGEYWLDAWTRITWQADEPISEIDPEGYLDFHRRVLAVICPGGPTRAQIARAESRSRLKAGSGGKARTGTIESPTTPAPPKGKRG